MRKLDYQTRPAFVSDTKTSQADNSSVSTGLIRLTIAALLGVLIQAPLEVLRFGGAPGVGAALLCADSSAATLIVIAVLVEVYGRSNRRFQRSTRFILWSLVVAYVICAYLLVFS